MAEVYARAIHHMLSAHPTAYAKAEMLMIEKLRAGIASSADSGQYLSWIERRVDFLILTALEKEFAPASKIFKAAALPKLQGDSNRYESAQVSTDAGYTYSVRLLCVGDQGSTLTSAVLTMALRSLNPRYVIMTGIAATIPGDTRRLGDVLIATHLVDMADHKVWPRKTSLRHLTHRCDRELKNEAQRFIRKSTKWKLHAHSGAIISQTDLVKSAAHRKQLVKLLQGVEPGLKPIGVEKEGGGVGIGAEIQTSDLKPGLLMVKAAVDFANYHKNDAVQRTAARRSAQFVYDFLSSSPVGVSSFQPTQNLDQEREHVYSLLQELGDRRFLHRSHGTWEWVKAVDSLDRMRASITKALVRLGPGWKHQSALEDIRSALHEIQSLAEGAMLREGWESVPASDVIESVQRMRATVRQKLRMVAEDYSLNLPADL